MDCGSLAGHITCHSGHMVAMKNNSNESNSSVNSLSPAFLNTNATENLSICLEIFFAPLPL
jgi:hypothetical protein